MKILILLLSVVATVVYTAPTAQAQSSQAHFAGTNVLGADGTVYFLRGESGLAPHVAKERVPYTSAGAFLSYKFNSWDKVVLANSADMALPLAKIQHSNMSEETTEYVAPRHGSLINDRGTVYFIQHDLDYSTVAVPFTSAEFFLSLGYSWGNVRDGDVSFLPVFPLTSPLHPPGTVINNNGTIYVIGLGEESGTARSVRIGFTSVDVFNSWGYSFEEAVPANSYDMELGAPRNAPIRQPEVQLNIPPIDYSVVW